MIERTVSKSNLLQGWLFEGEELGVKRKRGLTSFLKECMIQLEKAEKALVDRNSDYGYIYSQLLIRRR